MNRSLKIPNLEVFDETEEGKFDVVHVRSITPAARVCNLGCDPGLNGWREPRDINDVPHYWTRPTILRFYERRFRCPDCDRGEGKPKGNNGIYEHITFVQEGTWMTKRLIDGMAKKCVRAPFQEIAREVGVDRKTAAKAFGLRANDLVAARKAQVPRVLGIDEIKVEGAMRAVLGDVENKIVYDMLEDRTEKLEWHLIELSEHRNLDVLVTDRHDPYRLMIRRRMRGRLHVCDVWHIVRHANDALDEIRISVSKKLPNRRMGVALRNSKKLFHLRWHDASPLERSDLVDWFKLFPILADAYWTKERYCDLYLCASPAEAEAYYKDWLATLPPSVALAYKTKCAIPRRWMPMVLAYFEEPYTTGYVESVNRFLDDLQRDGRGYSFEVIRAKLMLAEKLERRTFRGRNSVTRIPVLPHADELIDGGEMYVAVESADDLLSIPRFGIDLEKVHALVTRPPQTIMWKGEERTLASELSTVWPRFMISPGQTRSTVFSR